MSLREPSWSPDDTERLAELYFAAHARLALWRAASPGEKQPQLGIEEIAAALGRSVGSVWNRIARTGMSTPGAKLRSCISCKAVGRERQFYSRGPGSRVCYDCTKSVRLRCA